MLRIKIAYTPVILNALVNTSPSPVMESISPDLYEVLVGDLAGLVVTFVLYGVVPPFFPKLISDVVVSSRHVPASINDDNSRFQVRTSCILSLATEI